MKKVFLFFLSVFAIFLISCGSKPAPEVKEEPTAPVIQEEPKEETVEVDEFSDEDYQKLITQIEQARELAIQTGADKNSPDIFNSIDEFYESLKADKNELSKNGEQIIARYELLSNYQKAKSAKEEIEENSFEFYAQNNYDEGVELLTKVEEFYASTNQIDESIKKAAKDSYSNFNTVLITAYKRIAKDEREVAFQSKLNADSVKAGVSRKTEYNAAVESFKSGDSSYSMQNPKRAIEHYIVANEQFTSLYEDVSKKRAAAQKAIEEAKKRVQESEQIAINADNDVPLKTSDDIDGIEDEDTILLEEDDYENPEDAEIEIAENIDGEIVEESNEFEVETEIEESDIEEEVEFEETELEEESKVEQDLQDELTDATDEIETEVQDNSIIEEEIKDEE